MPRDAVYVGRPTKWGNPHRDRNREVAVLLYRALTVTPELAEMARRELRGKDLACWCPSGPCHADVLLEIANWPPAGQRKERATKLP